MKKLLITLLLFTLFLSIGCSRDQKDMLSGMNELRKDNFPVAIEKFNKIIQRHEAVKDSVWYAAHFFRGKTLNSWYYETKDTTKLHESIEEFNLYLSRYPDATEVIFERGWAYFNLRRLDMALIDYSRQTELEPQNINSRYRKGLVLHRIGRADEAIAFLDSTFLFEPDNVKIRELIAVILQLEGRYEEAGEVCLEMIELDPENKSHYRRLGSIYWMAQQPDDAYSAFSKYIELAPNHADGYYERSGVSVLSHDWLNGLEDINRAIELDGTKFHYYDRRSYFHKKLGNIERAAADSVKADELKR